MMMHSHERMLCCSHHVASMACVPQRDAFVCGGDAVLGCCAALPLCRHLAVGSRDDSGVFQMLRDELHADMGARNNAGMSVHDLLWRDPIISYA